jgi:hypothetical protein
VIRVIIMGLHRLHLRLNTEVVSKLKLIIGLIK